MVDAVAFWRRRKVPGMGSSERVPEAEMSRKNGKPHGCKVHVEFVSGTKWEVMVAARKFASVHEVISTQPKMMPCSESERMKMAAISQRGKEAPRNWALIVLTQAPLKEAPIEPPVNTQDLDVCEAAGLSELVKLVNQKIEGKEILDIQFYQDPDFGGTNGKWWAWISTPASTLHYPVDFDDYS